jgi:hypothetical protein
MCVANVLVKEGYRPCLLKFGDIPEIVGIRLNTTPPILILCVYLPCRGNSNTDLFQETLDELSEIIEKYKNKANISQCSCKRRISALFAKVWRYT